MNDLHVSKDNFLMTTSPQNLIRGCGGEITINDACGTAGKNGELVYLVGRACLIQQHSYVLGFSHLSCYKV